MAMKSQRTAETVSALNELLRGELAAVETYNQALSVVQNDRDARRDLEECQASHQDRVLRLRAEILDRGGEPARASGAWGVFASLVERGASVVGARLAVGALEAGEDHGLKEYKDLLPRLDIPARSIVSADLYPQQVRTHSIISTLKTVMASPSPPLTRAG
jgi:demethoxyubiquinone hydroxylase (CLK1/Coq7/Cat5 family)